MLETQIKIIKAFMYLNLNLFKSFMLESIKNVKISTKFSFKKLLI